MNIHSLDFSSRKDISILASLWGAEFDLPTKEKTKAIVKKAEKKKDVSISKSVKSKKLSIPEKLEMIRSEVLRILGGYKSNTKVLYTENEVEEYLSEAISNGIIAVDTETNHSLDPLTAKLMGVCLYTPNQKQAYIPINHTDLEGNLLRNQVGITFIRSALEKLKPLDIIFHNGKFDYKVIKCTTGCELPITWDTMIGARLLNENERAGLKEQYISKIDPSIEKYSIEHLFSDIPYEYVDPELFALYAATDSFMTYKLYLWQKAQFELRNNDRLYRLFLETEMPLVPVLAEMELTGMCIDTEYAERLSIKYHRMLKDVDEAINAEMEKIYNQKIIEFKNSPESNVVRTGSKTIGEQIEIPVKVTSPTQLAILLYDVLKFRAPSRSKPRGTGEEELRKLIELYPEFTLGELVLEKRGLEKIIGTYVDKLVTCISPVDGRLHANFNQCGADTGRLSSSDPNLQNIPSKNNEIRMLFSAAPGKIFCGSDFSQQEPRLLANYSEDEKMIGAYKDGKDLYALIASEVYHNNYEDNKEFYPDGKMNPEGKHRRSSVKSILLGLMYGRGAAAIAEQIKTHDGAPTKEDIAEANKIIRSFYDGFPKVETWMQKTTSDAKINGYVEDLWGRRRRLPDIQLPQYEVSSKKSVERFNPILKTTGLIEDDSKIKKYRDMIESAQNAGEKVSIKMTALNDGIEIKDNGGFIAQAERQCVNSRVQGGAATMSKRAMVLVHNDPELKAMGFRLVNAVHDELIGEVSIENSERAASRLSELMIQSALPECKVPMKCDATCFNHWYEDVYASDLKEKYEILLSKHSEEDARKILYEEHCENTPEIIDRYLNY